MMLAYNLHLLFKKDLARETGYRQPIKNFRVKSIFPGWKDRQNGQKWRKWC